MCSTTTPQPDASVGATPRVQVLHLEDNANDHEIIALMVAQGGLNCDFVRCVSREEFEGLLKWAAFDLVLSDYTLPAFDGMSALAIAQKIQPDTPFIFVSGTIGEERAVEGLKSGAVDYVLKDRPAGLVPAMQRALREAHEKKERMRLEALLRQAQKMEAIGRLAGGLAHDFNNILTVIRSSVERVISEGQLDTHARANLGDVVGATERAASLTRQLSALGQKQVIQRAPLKLNDVIENLLKMLRRVLSKDIHLEWNCDPKLPPVSADIGMMEQVILNLVLNARDAMPEGGRLLLSTELVRVDAAHPRAGAGAREGEFVCCMVSDNGAGIAPEHLPSIFEPFFTTKHVENGTGLGLAMVYGIVKQHEGWVEVQTRVGAGSAFKVFLPVMPPPASLTPPEPDEAELCGDSELVLSVR